MPYYGLLDADGEEVVGEGYQRVNVAQALFAMAPASEPGDDVTFINIDMIHFPQSVGKWGKVAMVALYDEVDDTVPLISSPLDRGPADMLPGDFLVVAPGSLRASMRFRRPGKARGPKGGPDDGEVVVPDEALASAQNEIADLHRLLAEQRAINITLRAENARLASRLRRLRREAKAKS